jgi:phosphoglycerol transferase MdoB-like AlkP superfamily enzyme
MKRLLNSRFALVFILFATACALFLLLRTALLINNLAVLDLKALDVPLIYGAGLLYDLVFLSYLLIPVVVYLALLPDKRYQGRIHRYIAYILAISVIGIVTFDLVAEWLFWDEFQVRFNFISVDYLVYRREVTGNISESYPVPLLLLGVAICTLIVFAMIKRPIDTALKASSTAKARLTTAGVLLMIPLVSYFTLSGETFSHVSENNYKNELAKNGPYQFFYAFFANELSYEQFYQTGDKHVLDQRLRSLVQQDNQSFTATSAFDISRRVSYPKPEKKLNVMMIVVESLSGDYMTRFGNTLNLTPHLDQLANESLFFNHFYATGNRTVRGMEALTLSIPPTPGQSVIHRPHNEDLFSLGSLLRDKGYDSKFIYGGYGYFDNMNYFFSHNGFEIVDRNSYAKDESAFGNVWGVADEYSFLRAGREADKSYQAKKPFYSFIMTTSNHRPYTFPAGRVDSPSGHYEGAVKYTDYAIAKFIEDSRKKPWFDDTVFIIVADHCAGSAGKSDLPLERYHIPLFIYSPKHVKAQQLDTIASQIDVAPTLMGIMSSSYTSRFFGKDALRMKPEEGRALMGTYQKVALYRDNKMAVLSPNKKVDVLENVTATPTVHDRRADPTLVDDALAYYQGASYQLHNGLMLHKAGENH